MSDPFIDASGNKPKARLSLLQAAWVIARRDFLAILFSKSFFFFLLGPLFPLVVGLLAGGIGSTIRDSAGAPQVAVVMAPGDAAAMMEGYDALKRQMGPDRLPDFVVRPDLMASQSDTIALLESSEGNLAAVISGSPQAPVLTATPERLQRYRGTVALVASIASGKGPADFPPVSLQAAAGSGANQQDAQRATAIAGQTVLFLLIMLLAGMVLSNLVEEKGNKIIEILAAAIPLDALFLGKLFAMLGVSLVGVAVWVAVGAPIVYFAGAAIPDLPQPGVGWPAFILLGVAYFGMGYLLLGSLFLAIGSLATTVREVQTLSMPVTMAQVLLFFFANYALAEQGTMVEWIAIAFPLSSPFAMLAQAATQEGYWLHALALAWQAMWVLIAVRLGSGLFRRRVMQSGPAVKEKGGKGMLALLAAPFRNGSRAGG
ncbi:ABC transporter permease [Paraurantiacibacter namhicola]|uniref:ABC-2 family transporter protein n=1 Tax=Paraurantiacibacter namhicola TaxID=645517 RepID=A0A1C7D5Y8_9SPHN|nr:ABC transporter permease [Paraurantiacibacter namhicola]ANU06868.1 ABC-2 family transporter protein [Paraurantiacibacter namhicola]